MTTVLYPFAPGSGSRDIDLSDLFDYHDGKPDSKATHFGAGNGGQFSLPAGGSFSPNTDNIPAGKYVIISRSTTFSDGPGAQLEIAGRTIGPGESSFKIRPGDFVNISSATGGKFCLQCNHN